MALQKLKYFEAALKIDERLVDLKKKEEELNAKEQKLSELEQKIYTMLNEKDVQFLHPIGEGSFGNSILQSHNERNRFQRIMEWNASGTFYNKLCEVL